MEGLNEKSFLIVWKPSKNGAQAEPALTELRIQYYIRSKGFKGHIDTGQLADPDKEVTRLFDSPSHDGTLEQQMLFQSKSGEKLVADAESFSNSYEVFTLIKGFKLLKQSGG